MRLFLVLSLIATIIACSDHTERKLPLGFVAKEVILKGYLDQKPFCRVNLFVPSKYDILLDWYDYSDCSCCGSKKYRFANSKGCLIQESGFVYDKICTDSIDFLTIDYQCQEKGRIWLDSAGLNYRIKHIERTNKDMGYPPIVWKKKAIVELNGNTFEVIHTIGHSWMYQDMLVESISATTFSKRTFIYFRFVCKQKDCRGFVKNAYLMLNLIKIDSL